MKITDVKTWAVENPHPQKGGAYWIFVKLTTDNGIVGYGEVYGVPFAPRVVRQMIEDVASRHVVGRSPFDIETIWRVVYSSAFNQRPDVSIGGVLSGIEIACWDIIGKAVDLPIYNLMGGKVHERLRSYTYLYPAMDPEKLTAEDFHGDPDKAPNRLQQYMDMGFTAVGYDPVMPMGSFDPRQLSPGALEGAERFTRNLREVAGDKCDLMIKTHGQMTTSSAIRLARRLEQFDPLWFEEPVPPGNSKEMARVASATTIPIAGGERLVSRFEISQALEVQAIQILQPALSRVGGILEGKKDRQYGRSALCPVRAASLRRPDRGCCKYPTVCLLTKSSNLGKHRNLQRFFQRLAQQTDPVGRGICRCSGCARPRIRIERKRSRRESLHG